jgi:hypothetical protein
MDTPQEKIQNIKAWIKVQRKVANKRCKQADEARYKSGYSDIDALEQYSYNQGILITLDKIEQLLITVKPVIKAFITSQRRGLG